MTYRHAPIGMYLPSGSSNWPICRAEPEMSANAQWSTMQKDEEVKSIPWQQGSNVGKLREGGWERQKSKEIGEMRFWSSLALRLVTNAAKPSEFTPDEANVS